MVRALPEAKVIRWMSQKLIRMNRGELQLMVKSWTLISRLSFLISAAWLMRLIWKISRILNRWRTSTKCTSLRTSLEKAVSDRFARPSEQDLTMRSLLRLLRRSRSTPTQCFRNWWFPSWLCSKNAFIRISWASPSFLKTMTASI